MFAQKFTKLSAAVHELSSWQTGSWKRYCRCYREQW